MEKLRGWPWIKQRLKRLWKPGAPEAATFFEAETHCYAKKEGIALMLDLYTPTRLSTDRPLLLFVHGGGFSEGTRDDPRYVRFAHSMVHMGYPMALMSYRLTMRGRSFGCDQAADQKIAAFHAAAEDIWDATKFLLQHSSSWSLDAIPKIVLCGSSAGAEAVMHAAYCPDHTLPPHFRYAGLIGMAAAILDLNWITAGNALPSILFHGVDDPLVPFATASHHYCAEDQPGHLLLFGSEPIAGRLKELNQSYYLVKGLKGGHGWADKPMFDHLDLICFFLEQAIINGAHIQKKQDLYWV